MSIPSSFEVRHLRWVAVVAGMFLFAVAASVSLAAPGDVNNDGTIDEEDMALIAGHILLRAPLTGDALSRADANQDGNIDIADIVWDSLHQGAPTPTPSPTPDVSLQEAVDNTSLDFNTTGDALWFLETATSYFGGDAAQSGAIGANQQSRMETIVVGPGSLSYWYKVSSQQDSDYFQFDPDWWLGSTAIVSGEVNWSLESLLVPPGPHVVGWSYLKDASGSAGSDTCWVDRVQWTPSSIPSPNSSLANAVDNTSLGFSTEGDALWFRETSISQSGGDAAQSGSVPDQGVSWMITTITGPGSLSFSWKVSSEPNYDFLFWYLDSLLDGNGEYMTGEQDWTTSTVSIPAGTHTVTWVYSKDVVYSSGSDCGWVDNVVWAPGP